MPETINLEMRGGDFRAIVESGGDGPPLLYLHGAVGQKGWAPFLERLSGRFTVYAPYIPGYGEATGLEHLADLTDLTLYHLALLDALGVEQAHVVGHFLGGMIAAEMAAFSPPSVRPAWSLVSPGGCVARRGAGGRPAGSERQRTLGTAYRNPQTAQASLDGVADALARDRMQDIAAAGKFLWPCPTRGCIAAPTASRPRPSSCGASRTASTPSPMPPTSGG